MSWREMWEQMEAAAARGEDAVVEEMKRAAMRDVEDREVRNAARGRRRRCGQRAAAWEAASC